MTSKKKRNWTLEKIKKGLDKFYEENKRYPTSKEIDKYEYLPNSKTLQRKFGGVVSVRKQLNLKCQKDFTKGEYSSLRAKKINDRAHKIEKEVYDYLVGVFGLEFVHREYFFSDDKRARTDFLIYYKDGTFSIDVFYPADRHNLIGCLNSKIRTYSTSIMLQYPVIFLQANKEIGEEEIKDILSKKTIKLYKNQNLMNFTQLKEFCSSRVPLKIK